MLTVKKVLDAVLAWLTIILFAVLVVIVVWQVFTREVTGNPATWTEEAARQTFVWVGLIASAYVFGTRGHIAVEFLVRKFPARVEQIIALLVQLSIIAFAVIVMIWGGWRASQGAWNQNLSSLPFSLGQMYLALPVSGVLITLYSIYYLVQIARRAESPYPNIDLPSEAAAHTDAEGTVHDEGGPALPDGTTNRPDRDAAGRNDNREA